MEWARSCIACQQSKTQTHYYIESGIGSFYQRRRRFGHIYVDVVGPLIPRRKVIATFSPPLIDRPTAHHTTFYKPAANGMVERTHCSPKAFLMARCNNGSWLSQLPRLLLGLRIAIKNDLNISPAEMVPGQPLIVPAEFFHPQDSPESLEQLLCNVGKFTLCMPTHHREVKEYLPKHLHTSTFVFLRTDAHTLPLI
ncbi:uncharacterized protein LOC143037807 [Oratosquilla oratoria]|uniref:uncharacterized protein LOC143037807 n=1 Tax=Oratosquilla oratoria TaxID=337810 RepID=UPI003F7699BC